VAVVVSRVDDRARLCAAPRRPQPLRGEDVASPASDGARTPSVANRRELAQTPPSLPSSSRFDRGALTAAFVQKLGHAPSAAVAMVPAR